MIPGPFLDTNMGWGPSAWGQPNPLAQQQQPHAPEDAGEPVAKAQTSANRANGLPVCHGALLGEGCHLVDSPGQRVCAACQVPCDQHGRPIVQVPAARCRILTVPIGHWSQGGDQPPHAHARARLHGRVVLT